MPIPSNPEFLESVIGEAADVLPIPAQDYTDPTQTGALNYKTGWPAITALPLEAGGKAPRREYFNALMQLLSSHTFFQQSGSLYPWSATLDYLTGAHVLGSDGKEYIAQKSNGPDVPDSSSVDPVGDESGTWLPAGSVYAPLATTETPGIVQVGAGLQIAGGVLSTESSTTTATQDITFYVRQDGNDANAGTEDSPQGAWQTLQGALEKISAWDFSSYGMTLSFAEGTWDASATSLPSLGKLASAAKLVGSGTGGTVFTVASGFFSIGPSGNWALANLAFNINGGERVQVSHGYASFNNISFLGGNSSNSLLFVGLNGALDMRSCTFSGNAFSCIGINTGGTILMNGQNAISGGYQRTLDVYSGSFICASGSSFTGSATGLRFSVGLNGLISTNGGGPNFIPGNQAGVVSTTTGGIYA